jgi:GAF domain-containing protein
MTIPPGAVVRLTEDEVVNHPEYRNFSGTANSHPPLRGWLATSVCGEGGRVYGLLQLSDKARGAEFDADDEERVRELAGLLGAALDAVRAAAAS